MTADRQKHAQGCCRESSDKPTPSDVSVLNLVDGLIDCKCEAQRDYWRHLLQVSAPTALEPVSKQLSQTQAVPPNACKFAMLSHPLHMLYIVFLAADHLIDLSSP